jgi:hypothetical protein
MLGREHTLAAFRAHLSTGLALSGAAATTTLATGLATPRQTLLYLTLGGLGALLPDLDADGSAPTRIGLAAASLGIAFLTMFLLAGVYDSLAELVVVWVATYLAARAALFGVLTRVTVHRGMLHSLPAAACFGLATVAAAHHGLGADPATAWGAGTFVAGGYLWHLLLDELSAVNLFGARSRRSLGSALKLWSSHGAVVSLALYAAVAGLYLAAPGPADFGASVAGALQPGSIRDHLWPRDGWFQARRPAGGAGRPPRGQSPAPLQPNGGPAESRPRSARGLGQQPPATPAPAGGSTNSHGPI